MATEQLTSGAESRFPLRSQRDLYYVLFRHARPAALAFFGVLVTVLVYVASKPQNYRSEARLMVRPGRASLDPTAATGRTASASQSHQNEINSELEIIQSRDLLAAVAAKTLVPEAGGNPSALDTARNEAAEALAENLSVEALVDTNIIRIAYDDIDSARARAVLTELISRYLERHIEVHRTPGAYEFFNEQATERARKVSELELRIRDLKNEAGIASVDEQRTGLLERVHKHMLEIEDQRAELASIDAEMEAAELPQPTESLREDLNALLIEEEDLAARFTDAYPPLKSVRTRIASVERLLSTAQTTNLAAFSAQLASRRSVVIARMRALEAQVRIAREELEKLNGKEIGLTRLTNELEQQRANYARYAESLEQARIDQALQSEQISNISLIQPATLPTLPHGPSRAFLAVLGLILAVMAGAAVAFSLDFLDDSIHSPSVAEERLQLPVLAALPKSPQAPNPERWPGAAAAGGASSFTAELSALRDQLRNWRSTRSRAFPSASDEHAEPISSGVLRVRPGHGASSPALLAITSCEVGSGVSTVAEHLAASLARDGVKVLLVKAGGATSGAASSNGQANGHSVEMRRAIEVTEAGVKRQTLDLSKLARGEFPGVDELLWQLRGGAETFEFVILDLPQISGSDTVTRLAALSDGVLLVVEANHTRWQSVDRAKQILLMAQANVLGTVINRRQFPIPEWLYARL